MSWCWTFQVDGRSHSVTVKVTDHFEIHTNLFGKHACIMLKSCKVIMRADILIVMSHIVTVRELKIILKVTICHCQCDTTIYSPQKVIVPQESLWRKPMEIVMACENYWENYCENKIIWYLWEDTCITMRVTTNHCEKHTESLWVSLRITVKLW